MKKPLTPSEMGKKGGRTRISRMTREEIVLACRKAARARWKNHKKKDKVIS